MMKNDDDRREKNVWSISRSIVHHPYKFGTKNGACCATGVSFPFFPPTRSFARASCPAPAPRRACFLTWSLVTLRLRNVIETNANARISNYLLAASRCFLNHDVFHRGMLLILIRSIAHAARMPTRLALRLLRGNGKGRTSLSLENERKPRQVQNEQWVWIVLKLPRVARSFSRTASPCVSRSSIFSNWHAKRSNQGFIVHDTSK